jgi:diguanylate cyclase (GGDEF)-like protein
VGLTVPRPRHDKSQSDPGWACDDLPVAVVEIDDTLDAVRVNRVWKALGAGVSAADWLTVVQDDERSRVTARLRRTLRSRQPAALEVRGAAEGQWLELRIAAAGGRGLLVTVVDRTEQKDREESLAAEAVQDPLTGLLNRVALLQRAAQCLARQARQPSVAAVLFIDLDRFKQVNDRYGHRVGDRVLIAVGQRLAGAIRPSDTLARIGGDEFVVLCESLASEEEGFGVVNRLAAAIDEPFPVEGSTSVVLGATVGIAFAHGPGDDAAGLIDRADRAMYEAKEQGLRVSFSRTSDLGQR